MTDYARLIEIFEDLIKFKTVTGNQSEVIKCLDYARKFFDKADMRVNVHRSNGFESLVATTRKTKSPKLLLQAHIDVVPGPDSMFKLVGQADKLVGRGAFDMKYAVACYLRLIEELGLKVADYDIGVMLTTDEEENGLNGTDYLLDQGYSSEICILPDGGDNWQIEKAAKGVWQFDVVAEGTSAHASRPWVGDNAATKLLTFIAATKGLAPPGERTETTMVLSRLTAGDAYNQVPDKAIASYDVRYLEESDRETLEKSLIKLCDKHDVKCNTINRSAPISIDVTLPAIRHWEQMVTFTRGMPPAGYCVSYGASDARYFAARNIPTILTRPAGGGHHGDDEWISESELYEFYEVLKRYITTYGSAATAA